MNGTLPHGRISLPDPRAAGGLWMQPGAPGGASLRGDGILSNVADAPGEETQMLMT